MTPRQLDTALAAEAFNLECLLTKVARDQVPAVVLTQLRTVLVELNDARAYLTGVLS